jgi:hypothetical protein
MIKKDEQGRVVEYEYEPDLGVAESTHDRPETEASRPDGVAVVAPRSAGIAAAATEAEVDAACEAAARQVREDLETVYAKDVDVLARQVAVLAQAGQEKRRLARARRTAAVAEADRARKAAVLAADAACIQEIAEAGRYFCEQVSPLNERAAELEKTHQAALAAALANLEEHREKRRRALAEAEIADAKDECRLQVKTVLSQAG